VWVECVSWQNSTALSYHVGICWGLKKLDALGPLWLGSMTGPLDT